MQALGVRELQAADVAWRHVLPSFQGPHALQMPPMRLVGLLGFPLVTHLLGPGAVTNGAEQVNLQGVVLCQVYLWGLLRMGLSGWGLCFACCLL